jgi:hypothetical protein
MKMKHLGFVGKVVREFRALGFILVLIILILVELTK